MTPGENDFAKRIIADLPKTNWTAKTIDFSPCFGLPTAPTTTFSTGWNVFGTYS
jgi:hypothetical protein